MAALRPLALNPATGNPRAITAPDTIDPSVLPASSGVPVAVTVNYTVTANTQEFARFMKIDGTHDVRVPADSELVFA